MSTQLKDAIKEMEPIDYAKRMAAAAKGLDESRTHAMGVLLALMVAGGASLPIDDAIAKAREIAEGATPEELADLASEDEAPAPETQEPSATAIPEKQGGGTAVG